MRKVLVTFSILFWCFICSVSNSAEVFTGDIYRQDGTVLLYDDWKKDPSILFADRVVITNDALKNETTVKVEKPKGDNEVRFIVCVQDDEDSPCIESTNFGELRIQ